ncbi:LAME_0F01816g1_1 [Lachancea meyersii CBS 8951]|uniref:LAME_0F01816g1_1 n=1 Tax=Lachancea meyersii CBS 8951 TaxID=1266667 RepID=A0A1G4JQ25_9SACH|nr:LAME_0F01816g1_1 [Lachancea meyersii CBS 8951]
MPKIRIKKPRASETPVEKPLPKKPKSKAKSSNETGKASGPLRVKLTKKDSKLETERASPLPMKLKINLNSKEESSVAGSVTPKAPRFRIKPVRVPGEGYDSEASDIEDDPLIEDGIVLRVLPDVQTEFVKNCIESGDFSEMSLKWKGERHAVVRINGHQYGAILVNLPTIIEVNKSVDRKNLIKAFDVSQMLLCVKPIDHDEEVFSVLASDVEDLVMKHYEDYKTEIKECKKISIRGFNGGPLTDTEANHLERIVKKGYDYKHGLTPPLYNVRNRRFRRRLAIQEIDYVEKTVEHLLRQDAEAEEFTYDLVDEDTLQQRSSTNKEQTQPSMDDGFDLFGEDDHEDLEMELEQALQEDRPGLEQITADVRQQAVEETGDDVEQDNGEDDEEDEEEEEDEEDEEDAEDDAEEEDAPGQDVVRNVGKPAVDEEQQHSELLRDELEELEITLEQNRQKLEKATNPLLKSRFIESIKKMEKEAELKRKQLKLSNESSSSRSQSAASHQIEGEDDEEDDEEEDADADADDDDDDDDDDDATNVTNTTTNNNADDQKPAEELDQDDMDMMMLFGGEGDE